LTYAANALLIFSRLAIERARRSVTVISPGGFSLLTIGSVPAGLISVGFTSTGGFAPSGAVACPVAAGCAAAGATATGSGFGVSGLGRLRRAAWRISASNPPQPPQPLIEAQNRVRSSSESGLRIKRPTDELTIEER
jgi:hypothetical protein